MCVSHSTLCILSTVQKMTTPLKLPENDEVCVELEKIGDHVCDGRLLLFTSCPIRLKYELGFIYR